MKTVLTSQIPWKGLRYAQGFANRAVTNVGNAFKKFACKGKKRWWIAMSCRIRRAFQLLLDRVLASLSRVSKLLWLPQLITNALFGGRTFTTGYWWTAYQWVVFFSDSSWDWVRRVSVAVVLKGTARASAAPATSLRRERSTWQALQMAYTYPVHSFYKLRNQEPVRFSNLPKAILRSWY